MGKRVILLFSDLGLGGVQTKLISLANGLVRRHVPCVVLLQTKKGFSRAGELDRRVQVICPVDIEIFGKHPFWGWRFRAFIVMVLIFLQPRSIFVSLAPISTSLLKIFNYIAPWMLKRVIVNEDTYPSLYYGDKHAGRASIHDVKTWYSKAKAVIAVSKSTYDDLSKNLNISSPPLVYISNWVTTRHKFPNRTAKRTIDLVYAGRLARQKQPGVLAGVLHGVLQKHPRASIRIYADGPMKGEFIRALVRLGIAQKIEWYDPVVNIDHVLKRAKCLLFTSQFEGMPFVGLEAMASGAVVAGFDVPGLRDIVEDNKTGILAVSQEVLSSKVVTLLHDSRTRNRLARNAARRVRDEFSEKNRNRLIAILLEQ